MMDHDSFAFSVALIMFITFNSGIVLLMWHLWKQIRELKREEVERKEQCKRKEQLYGDLEF